MFIIPNLAFESSQHMLKLIAIFGLGEMLVAAGRPDLCFEYFSNLTTIC